jgi:predicted kinase
MYFFENKKFYNLVIRQGEIVPKVYFISGFIGSGKTTYSKQLAETKSAFRFSIDEWMLPLFGEHMSREDFDARIAKLENLFKESALQMTNLGISVIFDLGYWTKEQRDHCVKWAVENNIDSEIHYLDVSFEECCHRAKNRNENLEGKSYEMTDEMLEMFWSWFEVPSDEKVVMV